MRVKDSPTHSSVHVLTITPSIQPHAVVRMCIHCWMYSCGISLFDQSDKNSIQMQRKQTFKLVYTALATSISIDIVAQWDLVWVGPFSSSLFAGRWFSHHSLLKLQWLQCDIHATFSAFVFLLFSPVFCFWGSSVLERAAASTFTVFALGSFTGDCMVTMQTLSVLVFPAFSPVFSFWGSYNQELVTNRTFTLRPCLATSLVSCVMMLSDDRFCAMSFKPLIPIYFQPRWHSVVCLLP